MSSMKDCISKPLTEVLETIIDNRGKSVPTVENGFPLIATNCIKNSSIYPTFEKIRYVSQETLESWFRAELQPNDILFVNKGTPGRVCLAPNPITFCAAQDMVGLRCNSKVIYYKYLFAVLRSDTIQQKIANFHVGIAIPHFKKSDMHNISIPLPDMTVQQSIGDIYCTISEKIELNNRINRELENLTKTIYDYWISQFEFPDNDSKPYKSSGGKMVWNEELKREIPEGWEVKTLNDCCLYNQESLKSTDNWSFINYLDTSNINCNKISTIEKLDCETQKIPSRAKRKVTENAIVFSTVRPNQRHHGLIKKPLKNMIVSTGFVVITHKENVKFNDLIYTFLTQEIIENQLQTIADTSVSSYPSINSSDIMNLKIVLPKDINLLERISNKFYSINQMIWKKHSEIKELILLRDWLLSKFMNGQITFKVGDDIEGKHFDAESVAETSFQYYE